MLAPLLERLQTQGRRVVHPHPLSARRYALAEHQKAGGLPSRPQSGDPSRS